MVSETSIYQYRLDTLSNIKIIFIKKLIVISRTDIILSHIKVKLVLFTKFDILNVWEGSFLIRLGTGNLVRTQPCLRKVLQSISVDYFRVSM